MADEIQEKMLEAIDVLINNRLNQLDSNTTVNAVITGILDTTGTQYSCEGNGDTFNAVSTTDVSFAIGDSVYVLMSKEKNIILGKADFEDVIETSLATKNNYYFVGGNIASLNNYIDTIGISSYKKSDGKLIYEYGNEENSLINISELELAKFTRYIEEADALLLQATFQTNLPIHQTRNITGVYGLKIILNFEQDSVKWTKTIYLNSPAMSGNPYQYTSPNKQYRIFNLKNGEGKYFKNIQSIEFIGGNFVAINDATKTDENIFCSEIKLICLEPIERTEGYYLLIDTPAGACFNSSAANAEELTVNVNAYYNKTNVSAICSYSWFIEDGRIDTNNINYRSIAGTGWRYIGSENMTKTFSSTDNQALKTNYLCVATYNNETIIKQHFSLFNISNNLSKIKIFSEDGKVNFSFNNNSSTLICSVNDKTDFDDTYSFSWYKVEGNNYNLITDEATAQNAYELLKSSLGENVSSLDLSNALAVVNNCKDVVLNGNKLTYPIKNIVENKAIFVCQVYHNDIFIGQSSITLTNAISDSNKQVIINNGNQVFQYTEAGISPCSESLAEPQEILPLTAQAFDMIDNLIPDTEIQSVIWRFPLSSESMIVPPADVQLSAQNDYYYINTTIDQPINFTIRPIYNLYTNNNQITVIIQTISGETYTGSTDFTFTKIGNFENNGTNLIAKISPIDNVENLILFLEKTMLGGNEFYVNANQGINIDYDGINNKDTALAHRSSIRDALMSLETAADRKTKCGYWAEYVKKAYLEDSSITGLPFQKYKTLYSDLNKVSRGQKTVDEILFDYLENKQSELSFKAWNDGKPSSAPRLKVKLYKAGIEVEPSKVVWSILGSSTRSKYLVVSEEGTDSTRCIVSVKTDNELNTIRAGTANNLIIQAKVTYTDEENKENTCYATYPINLVIIGNEADLSEDFGIIEKQTLRSVMYNSDGRNPVYNANQGVALKGAENFLYRYWIPEGGIGDSSANAPMTTEKDETDSLFCKVIPNNIYSGESTNTNIHVILYTPPANREFGDLTSIYKEYGQPKVEVFIPIHFYLNTYGLASVNAWDGNHLEINEEENYILAPQIGAGRKEGDNSFTGLVMGEAKFYDDIDEATGEIQPSSSIGLLGYTHGKQSIFLDAETGTAIFGLPEQRASAENNYTEGRVIIQPGGESKIGMWTIGSRALYNINQGLQYVDENGEPLSGGTSNYVAPIGYDPDLLKGSYLNNDEIGLDYTDFQNHGNMKSYGYAPYFRYYGSEGWISSQKGAYDIKNASIVVPPDAQGLILSANPAFISAKTMPLKHTNQSNKVNTIEEDPQTHKRYLLTDINLGQGDTILQEGDSLEVQINPNSASPFGIFRHTKYPVDGTSNIDYPKGYAGDYYRYPLMGINHNGQLFVNSLQNGEMNLKIGQIEAFGYQSGTTAENSPFLGHKFIYTDVDDQDHEYERIISKIFINKNEDTANSSSPLYITGGQDQTNEYIRPISMHGKSISLYATAKPDIDVLTSHRLTIADDNIEMGHLAAASYTTNERIVTPTNRQVGNWDEYKDITYPSTEDPRHVDFTYSGSVFESNISTTYTSNGVTITPGGEYYVNESTPSDIRLTNNNNLLKITKNSQLTFADDANLYLRIIKVCIPVHWNKSGIIDAVCAYDENATGTRTSIDTAKCVIKTAEDADIDEFPCCYMRGNGNNLDSFYFVKKTSIYPSALIGKHFNSVLTTIVKIFILPQNSVSVDTIPYTVEQMDLHKNFIFTLQESHGTQDVIHDIQYGQAINVVKPDYPDDFSKFTLRPMDLERDAANADSTTPEYPVVQISGTYNPPIGYFLYKANSGIILPYSNSSLKQKYIISQSEILISNEEDNGAFFNIGTNQSPNYQLYWLQTITAAFLKDVLPSGNKTIKVKVPITTFATNSQGQLTLATDACGNSWIGHFDQIDPIDNSKTAYNYLNIGNDEFNITDSVLNLPTNNFALSVQNGLFNLNAFKANANIAVNTTKGLKISTAAQTEFNLVGSGNIQFFNYNTSGKKLAEISASKENSTTGSFLLGAWSGSTQIAKINSDINKNLFLYSANNTTQKAGGAYYLHTLGTNGIDITASNSSSSYGAHNKNTAYLKLAPGTGSGTFILQGGNNYMAADSKGLRLYSDTALTISTKNTWMNFNEFTQIKDNTRVLIQGKDTWVSLHEDNRPGVIPYKNILQTNADVYLSHVEKSGNNTVSKWHTLRTGAVVIKNPSDGNAVVLEADTNGRGTVTATGSITATGEVTGNGVALSSHTHPFRLTGSAQYGGASFNTKKILYETVVTAYCYNTNTSSQYGDSASYTVYTSQSYNTTVGAFVMGSLQLYMQFQSTGNTIEVDADTGSQGTGQPTVIFDTGWVTSLTGYTVNNDGVWMNISSATMGSAQ